MKKKGNGKFTGGNLLLYSKFCLNPAIFQLFRSQAAAAYAQVAAAYAQEAAAYAQAAAAYAQAAVAYARCVKIILISAKLI